MPYKLFTFCYCVQRYTLLYKVKWFLYLNNVKGKHFLAQIFGRVKYLLYLCTRNQVGLVSKAERWHISELMRNNRYRNSVSQQYGEVELCNTPRTSYTELGTLSKHKDKEVSNTHHARWKNASRVRLEKYRNTLTHER